MKKVLVVLAVLICNYVYGQDSLYILSYKLISPDLKSDTSKVIMLICDTSQIVNFFDSIVYMPSHKVYWIYGYEIKIFVPEHWEPYDRQASSNWEATEYLDDKKKLLSKNIIVWQTKNR